jgi:circadian clock protein KaiB
MRKKPVQKVIVQEKIILQLYVSGMSAKSMTAIENIQRLCNEFLSEAFELEIIDIYKNPEAAAESHIVFSPSLVKRSPPPKKIMIGTLADTQKIIKALGITFKS